MPTLNQHGNANTVYFYNVKEEIPLGVEASVTFVCTLQGDRKRRHVCLLSRANGNVDVISVVVVVEMEKIGY